MDEFGGFESMPGWSMLTDAYCISGPVVRGSVASPKSTTLCLRSG
jgi:hypothetical protein